jgi:hypothetical protein
MDRSFYIDQPDQPDYGMVNWYDRRKVFYGDDNARVIWASLAARHALNNDRWDERIMTCLLANLRTTGKNGFRRGYLETSKSFANGRDWKYFYNEELSSCLRIINVIYGRVIYGPTRRRDSNRF